MTFGADLEPGTLLHAYRHGYFPMHIEPHEGSSRREIGWWSPQPRGVIKPHDIHVSRSLSRSLSQFTIKVDTAFEAVLEGCANPQRPHGWIGPEIKAAYTELHELGWVHSIEAWDTHGIAGGVYGVGIGAFFAGESMFHARTNGSKAALVGLARLLQPYPDALIDVQWTTPHLVTMGAIDIDRTDYLNQAKSAMFTTGPAWPTIMVGHD